MKKKGNMHKNKTYWAKSQKNWKNKSESFGKNYRNRRNWSNHHKGRFKKKDKSYWNIFNNVKEDSSEKSEENRRNYEEEKELLEHEELEREKEFYEDTDSSKEYEDDSDVSGDDDSDSLEF